MIDLSKKAKIIIGVVVGAVILGGMYALWLFYLIERIGIKNENKKSKGIG